MRGIFVPIAVISIMTSTAALADQRADTAAIKAVFDDFQASWNTPGLPGFEKLFLPDADFVVITGKWLRGRDEIVSYHRNLLKTVYAGSSQFVDQVTVHFTDDQHSVAHVAWGVKYNADGKEVRRTALATATLRKDHGTWMIQTIHNTLTGGPGYNFPNSPPPPK